MVDLLLRREVFGVTCFHVKTSTRFYLNNDEFINFILRGQLPNNLNIKLDENFSFKIIGNQLSDAKKFSFADTVYIELTRRCNLRCKHCLNNSGLDIENSLTKKEVLDLILKLYNAGLQEIRFTGGEPLLFDGIEECVALAHSLGLKTSLGTNGTLLTEEKVKKLTNAGINQIIVSLDGTKDKHDFIRGNGNFERTMRGLKNAITADIDVRVNSVLMKSNKEDVINLAKELDKIGVKLFIRRFIQTGRAENLVDEELDGEEYQNVKIRLQEQLNRNIRGHELRNDNGSHSRIPLCFDIDTCRAGQRTLDITPNGDIYPCGFLAAQGYPPFANVRDILDWNEFWNTIQSDKKLSNLRENMKIYNETSSNKCSCLAKYYSLEKEGIC